MFVWLNRFGYDGVAEVRNGALHAVFQGLCLGEIAVNFEFAVGQGADGRLEEGDVDIRDVLHVASVIARVCNHMTRKMIKRIRKCKQPSSIIDLHQLTL